MRLTPSQQYELMARWFFRSPKSFKHLHKTISQRLNPTALLLVPPARRPLSLFCPRGGTDFDRELEIKLDDSGALLLGVYDHDATVAQLGEDIVWVCEMLSANRARDLL